MTDNLLTGATHTNSAREEWQHPPRPDWVQQLNDEGRCMDIRSVVPLDEQSLLDSAQRATGLFDFGADDWYEPFNVYVKALDEEADLNLMGRLRARQEVLLFLQARLRIEDTYKKHPEIENEQIREPIVVTGQGRSGTSFLQNVLSANPRNETLRHWEMILPCPPPEQATYRSDPRIEQADRLVTQWTRVAPTLEGMHEFGGDMPFEDHIMMSANFTSEGWLGIIGQVPSYALYLADQDPKIAMRYHKRVLKLLQWRNPREHWVLKSVVHLDQLPALFSVYPDACVVWAHRDPVRSLASMIDIMATMQWVGSDDPLKHGALDFLRDPNVSAARFNNVIDLIESKVIPSEQICHVHYKDLIRDTMGTVERIYDHFGIPLTDDGRAGMQRYLGKHPRDDRPPHRYPIAEGSALTTARAAYQRYQDYFNIPIE